MQHSNRLVSDAPRIGSSGQKPGNGGIFLKLPIALTIAMVTAIAAAAACSSGKADEAKNLPAEPGITIQRSTSLALEHQWGDVNHWQIEGANWSIDLPEEGRWDFGGPLNESGFSPNAATYRSDNGTLEVPEPFTFVDVLRFDLASLAVQSCTRPTIIDPDGGLISVRMDDMQIDGHTATVSRITSPARDGSGTGTFEICFVTGDSMYQLTAAARPLDAQADLFTMLGSFTLTD